MRFNHLSLLHCLPNTQSQTDEEVAQRLSLPAAKSSTQQQFEKLESYIAPTSLEARIYGCVARCVSCVYWCLFGCVFAVTEAAGSSSVIGFGR